MTANELLTLLGRAWSRLLIYPGGLAAFGAAWLMFEFSRRVSRNPATSSHTSISLRAGPLTRSGSAVIVPWLALALLPLPLAVALPRQIDIVVVLTLLEWPNILAIGQELRAGGMRRLTATLNSYPPLILATLALAQAGNSLELAALVRDPGDTASISTRALHWLGVIALALALPPALGIGPFGDERPTTEDERPTTEDGGRRTKDGGRTTKDGGRRTNDEGRRTNDEGRRTKDGGRTTNDQRRGTNDESPPSSATRPHAVLARNPQSAISIGLRLRALGLVTLAALPWAGAEGTGLALLRMLGAAALIAALLWGMDRLTRGQAVRRWAWVYLALNGVLLLALLGAAYMALQLRLA
ncbi:MAG: hypothetical protein ABIV47_10300 [Roseiflexaceae bacterium]